jgi:hypothetical protein
LRRKSSHCPSLSQHRIEHEIKPRETTYRLALGFFRSRRGAGSVSVTTPRFSTLNDGGCRLLLLTGPRAKVKVCCVCRNLPSLCDPSPKGEGNVGQFPGLAMSVTTCSMRLGPRTVMVSTSNARPDRVISCLRRDMRVPDRSRENGTFPLHTIHTSGLRR